MSRLSRENSAKSPMQTDSGLAGTAAQGSHATKSSHSLQSGGSRASISVTLPTTITKPADLQRQSPVQVRQLSPDRLLSGTYGTQVTPDNIGIRQNYSPQSSGTIPPVATPTHPGILNEIEIHRIIACRAIERAWLSYRDKQMFKLLKHAVCAAEHSLSYEVLRKVAPREAEFLKDKSMQTKVRFRFGGLEFPPLIYFKIYSCTAKGGMGIQYVSGKKMIQPASEAARDACDLMGHRRFYDQMIRDVIHHDAHKITDEVDVTTLKDYMQYLSLMDETPSYMGGKDNSWRKLTLEVLPRHTIFYDVVDYLYNHKMSVALRDELPTLLSRPLSEDVQLRHIKIISQIRTPLVNVAPNPTPKSALSGSRMSSRRSKQARSRASKLRKAYDSQRRENSAIKENTQEELREGVRFEEQQVMITQQYADDDAWEEEADKLYEWTRDLTLDELMTPTPRISGAY